MVGGGQVINLATGSNETSAALQAASSVIASTTPPCSLSGLPTNAPYAGVGKHDEERINDAIKSTPRSSTESAEAVDTGENGDDGGEHDGGSGAAAAEARTAPEGVAEGLEGMSAGSLVATFRRAQEERVALYRKFNR